MHHVGANEHANRAPIDRAYSVPVQTGYQHTMGRGGTRRNTPWSPEPGTKEGEGCDEGYELYINQATRKMNVGTGIPPFVSELGAALLGWRRGYLGFPTRTTTRDREWWLVVDVLFLNRVRLGFVEQPMVCVSNHSNDWKGYTTYTSCSMIQLSRLDASCSRRFRYEP